MILKTEPSILTGYLEDASGFTGGHAERLALAEAASEVAPFLAEASAHREPVTVSGGGTGVTAGRIPRGGTLLSLERLDAVGEIARTPEGGELTVGPGAHLEAVKAAAFREGLGYAPDPTERTGTLGGNLATNASGGQSFKYGPTRAHVLGLSLAFPTGETLTLRRGRFKAEGDWLRFPLDSGRGLEFRRPRLPAVRVAKNAAGFYSAPDMDALDLFIGMEGALGVITSATLRLLPAPAGIFTLAFFFPDLEAALACAAVIRRSAQGLAPVPGIAPASLEFMDARALDLLRPAFPVLPDAVEACLLIEQEYPAGDEDEALGAWSVFLARQGVPEGRIWFAADDADRERLREFRHALPEAVNTIVRRRGFAKVGTDLAVPDDAFSTLFEFYLAALRPSGLEHLMFGHIGDCHLHVNVLPRTEDEVLRARALYLGFAAEAVRLGGTVSAEHGIGKLKHDFLALMVGEEGLREMVRIKRIFDPALILNRGNLFPERLLEAPA
jgi:D-lactate dehydrogenase (cytochrome)